MVPNCPGVASALCKIGIDIPNSIFIVNRVPFLCAGAQTSTDSSKGDYWLLFLWTRQNEGAYRPAAGERLSVSRPFWYSVRDPVEKRALRKHPGRHYDLAPIAEPLCRQSRCSKH